MTPEQQNQIIANLTQERDNLMGQLAAKRVAMSNALQHAVEQDKVIETLNAQLKQRSLEHSSMLGDISFQTMAMLRISRALKQPAEQTMKQLPEWAENVAAKIVW